MQIPKLGFLSLLSFVSLASSSAFIRCATPTEFPDQVTINADKIYGWKGSGFYRITGLSSGLNVDRKADGSVINLQPESNSNTQRWLISAAGEDRFIIVNNRNGNIVSATASDDIIKDNAGPPSDHKVLWKIDTKTWADKKGSPVVFVNTAFSPKSVLEAFHNEEVPGTKIIVSPLESTLKANQAWLLEYLEEP